MNSGITLATKDDAGEILTIYSPYIMNTAITFEYEVPTLEEFEHRIVTTNAKYPYLVYRIEGKIVGYAYASPFKARAAYSWDAETSIYLHPNYHHKGIGQKLYKALIALLKLQGYHHLYAYITYPNEASIGFHEKFGFNTCGRYQKTGYKLGTWRDVVCMDLCLFTKEELETTTSPKASLPISALKKETIEKILMENS